MSPSSRMTAQLTRMTRARMLSVPAISGHIQRNFQTFGKTSNVNMSILENRIQRVSMSSMTVPEILVKVENNVRTITIDRQAKKNAINGSMYKAISDAIRSADLDVDTNVIVLTGKGDYYTAGNDMKDPAAVMEKAYTPLIHALIDVKKPVVVLINGHAIGIGVTSLGLVDAAYSVENATFLTPFSRLGIVAEGCSTYTFPRIMGNAKASELLLFSKKITASEAYDYGLLTAVFPAEEFQERSWAKIRAIAELPLKSVIYSKELIRGRDRAFLHELNEKEADKLIQCVKGQ